MHAVTVGKIQKNFAAVLKEINTGEEIIITRRGKPVARLTALGPATNIDWPDFLQDDISVKGKTMRELVTGEREERF